VNRGVLAELRSLCPPRRLTHFEALRVAEVQAARLLKLSGIAEPPVPESVVQNVPKVLVKRMVPWAVSGATDWAKGTWVIVVNGAEPQARQRFTVAHEFKHILDYPFIDVLYPASLGMTRHKRTEAVCDFFAGCLLVPRPWLKQAWVGGIQDIPQLAEHFGVSNAAMETRLLQTGLIDRPERCRDEPHGWRFLRIGDGRPMDLPTTSTEVVAL
jgi:hypothetical protein